MIIFYRFIPNFSQLSRTCSYSLSLIFLSFNELQNFSLLGLIRWLRYLKQCLFKFLTKLSNEELRNWNLSIKLNLLWGHLYSTYAQTEREGVQPNAYDCVQGGRGGFKVAYVHKKTFFSDHKISKLFFLVQKKLLHCHLLLCIEKFKPALNYKQKP